MRPSGDVTFRMFVRAARSSGGLPTGVWALGFASLFMDASSELIHSLLPIFMVSTLGASMVMVGAVEGTAEAAASVMKVFSGALADIVRRRKPVVVAGYLVAALTKPIFPLATSMGWVFTARFVDRLGKGMRGAPRDALVADLVDPSMRGAAYGLRQALDSIGAVIGPVLAVTLMSVYLGDLRKAMWFAAVPAAVAVVLLVAFVDEPAHPIRSDPVARVSLLGFRELPGRYWLVVAAGATIGLARFSEAFLVLRGQNVGMDATWAPLVMVVMSAVYAVAAYPAGMAADRMPPGRLMSVGLLPLVAADGVLAFATSEAAVFLGAALWGAHMGLTQGLLSKLVADSAPARLLGTAFGLFHLVTGGALLLASVLAGALWSAYGAAATFLAGAAFAVVAAFGIGVLGRR